jgi:hypothetical protein
LPTKFLLAAGITLGLSAFSQTNSQQGYGCRADGTQTDLPGHRRQSHRACEVHFRRAAAVLINVIRDDTKGASEPVNTKYELLERGGYIPTGYKFDPVVLNTKLPLEFFEARCASRNPREPRFTPTTAINTRPS